MISLIALLSPISPPQLHYAPIFSLCVTSFKRIRWVSPSFFGLTIAQYAVTLDRCEGEANSSHKCLISTEWPENRSADVFLNWFGLFVRGTLASRKPNCLSEIRACVPTSRNVLKFARSPFCAELFPLSFRFCHFLAWPREVEKKNRLNREVMRMMNEPSSGKRKKKSITAETSFLRYANLFCSNARGLNDVFGVI